ncbi:Qat anti-phage system associated protein QatB [Clostridium tertium]|uniref:Qat anti-phage system associated protein QatB n=1 Tax=Clostridium tertium TaxID=1559 RepID=UPI00374F2A4A
MGTSTSNAGQKGSTPLVPSWLDDEENQENDLISNQGDSERFRAPRNNFTRFVNDGGRDTSNLHKATFQYIKNSLGGAKNATMRLGAAKNSTARLFSIFNGFINNGVDDTSKKYGLGELIGKSAKEVFLNIMDFVCPNGGSTDEGIARSSYIETLMSLSDIENKSIENLTDFEFLAFTENYMTNIIQERLVNDIGNKIISLPKDIGEVEFIQRQINDYISGAVSDSISALNLDIKNIDNTQTISIVESVYEKAYNILASLEE